MITQPRVAIVAEDEPLTRMFAAAALIDAGFDVIECECATEVVAFLHRQKGDVGLLMTDIEMPGVMDGLELAHFVRDLWPQIPLLIVSACERPRPAQLPRGSRFLPKPYAFAKIAEYALELTGA